MDDSLTVGKGEQCRLVLSGRGVHKLRDEPVAAQGVVLHEFHEASEPGFGGDEELLVLALLDAVVIDSAVEAERDRPLVRRGLAGAHEEGPVDAGGEKELGRVSGDGAVVPRVSFQ